MIKSLEKYITWAIGHKTISYRDKRQKRSFYRDLDLKKVENHCTRVSLDSVRHIVLLALKYDTLTQWFFTGMRGALGYR
jgi:hypothetical protein